MSVLQQICDKKRQHVAHQKFAAPIADLKAIAADQPAPRGFITTLKSAEFPVIIAEVKKASPSKGIIRKDFNPAEIVTIYKDNGAACLSVLTDEPYFQGTDEIFKTVRATVNMPLLRKDFMVDNYQITESRALGADCILIIMAALEDSQAEDLYGLATDQGMDVLVETHNEEEIHRALQLKPEMIGVNNRNLKTLDVTIQTSIDLAALIPDTTLKVAESGLADHATLKDLKNYGYNTFLIGESLMRQPRIDKALRSIRGAQ